MFRYKYETFPKHHNQPVSQREPYQRPKFSLWAHDWYLTRRAQTGPFQSYLRVCQDQVELFTVCERTTGLNKKQSLMIAPLSSRSSPATGRTGTLPRIIVGNWVTQENGDGPSRTHYSVPQRRGSNGMVSGPSPPFQEKRSSLLGLLPIGQNSSKRRHSHRREKRTLVYRRENRSYTTPPFHPLYREGEHVRF